MGAGAVVKREAVKHLHLHGQENKGVDPATSHEVTASFIYAQN